MCMCEAVAAIKRTKRRARRKKTIAKRSVLMVFSYKKRYFLHIHWEYLYQIVLLFLCYKLEARRRINMYNSNPNNFWKCQRLWANLKTALIFKKQSPQWPPWYYNNRMIHDPNSQWKESYGNDPWKKNPNKQKKQLINASNCANQFFQQIQKEMVLCSDVLLIDPIGQAILILDFPISSYLLIEFEELS